MARSYRIVLQKMVECGMLESEVVSVMSTKERDVVVINFMKENPDIMLACVHWKLQP